MTEVKIGIIASGFCLLMLGYAAGRMWGG